MRELILVAAFLVAGCAQQTTTTVAAAGSPKPCGSTEANVQLFGAFQKPGPLPYEPGLTVFAAIERGGGLTDGATVSRLSIKRCGHSVGPFEVPAMPGAPTDVPLERGDVLDVPIESW